MRTEEVTASDEDEVWMLSKDLDALKESSSPLVYGAKLDVSLILYKINQLTSEILEE